MKKVGLLFLAFLLLGATFPTIDVPRNLRFKFAPTQVNADSLSFDLKWNAPQEQGGSSAIEGYEWQLLRSRSGASVVDSLLFSGTTLPNNRQALMTTPITCGGTIIYQARVRAIGSWDIDAAWGSSNTINFYCANLPPGAPIVTLDTIAGGG